MPPGRHGLVAGEVARPAGKSRARRGSRAPDGEVAPPDREAPRTTWRVGCVLGDVTRTMGCVRWTVRRVPRTTGRVRCVLGDVTRTMRRVR
jgi:hypothetical protein